VPQLALEASRHPDLSLTYWNDYLVRGASVMADVLRRGVAEGTIRPGPDFELAVDLLTGPLFKRSMWQLPTSDDDLRATVAVVLAGLAPHGGPQRGVQVAQPGPVGPDLDDARPPHRPGQHRP